MRAPRRLSGRQFLKLPDKKKNPVRKGRKKNWCRMAELNCRLTLTKGLYYRYTNPATAS
jgi:hypothetical protein